MQNTQAPPKGGCHEDPFAALSVCDAEEGMHSLFAGIVPEQYLIDLQDSDDRAEAFDARLSAHDDIAAVLVEPLILGADGMCMHSPETLEALQEACNRHGGLLIFDEIFTGFGRTGDMFSADRAGVTQDLLCLGKVLAGGVTPLAATIASRKVYDASHTDSPEHALMRGPAFTGHAICWSVANAGLDLFESEPRLEKVHAIERQLVDEPAPLVQSAGHCR